MDASVLLKYLVTCSYPLLTGGVYSSLGQYWILSVRRTIQQGQAVPLGQGAGPQRAVILNFGGRLCQAIAAVPL